MQSQIEKKIQEYLINQYDAYVVLYVIPKLKEQIFLSV